MPRSHRLDTYYRATCNGDDDRYGCGWTTDAETDGWLVKRLAQSHARQKHHEAVVTETAMVVYDMRLKALTVTDRRPQAALEEA